MTRVASTSIDTTKVTDRKIRPTRTTMTMTMTNTSSNHTIMHTGNNATSTSGSLRRLNYASFSSSLLLLVTIMITSMTMTVVNAFSAALNHGAASSSTVVQRPFYASSSSSSSTTSPPTTALRMVHNIRDADYGEWMAGGERYEMVPLPDSMLPTTIFVGNLCEFCNDDDLCRIFQSVSTLQSVPAIVARKPNMNSLRYGFVSFPTVEEKESAILRFHGVEFMGRKLKVEEIRDHHRMGRVRVPEKIVAYVCGTVKRHSKKNRSSLNTMRRISRLEEENDNVTRKARSSKLSSRSSSSMTSSIKPPPKKLNNKKRAIASSNNAVSVGTQPRKMIERPTFSLTMSEQEEMDRAKQRGYISLEGSTAKGYTRRRCTQSRLAAAYRQWCDEQAIPHIVHCKASAANNNKRSNNGGGGGGKSSSVLLDYIIVDLSTLRVHTDGGGMTSNDFDVNEFVVRWKAEIAAAAAMTGMELQRRRSFNSKNYELLSSLDDDGDEEDFNTIDDRYELFNGENDEDSEECALLTESCEYMEDTISLNTDGGDTNAVDYVLELSDDDSWSMKPISDLPFLSMGIFEGERSEAKTMAKELAQLWGTGGRSRVDDIDNDDDDHVYQGSPSNNMFFPIEDDMSHQIHDREMELQPALYSSNRGNSRDGNRSSSDGPSRRHRKKENRRRRRRNNSRDLNYMF